VVDSTTKLNESQEVIMEAKEVIERFCKLQSEVQDVLGWDNAADCFCGKGGLWGMDSYGGAFESGYRNDGEALEFIEDAVREKLKTLKVNP
jgi:hypothetical protein